MSPKAQRLLDRARSLNPRFQPHAQLTRDFLGKVIVGNLMFEITDAETDTILATLAWEHTHACIYSLLTGWTLEEARGIRDKQNGATIH